MLEELSGSRAIEDARLLKQAKAGDADAFGVLYDQYSKDIFRFLFAQMSNRMDAEDLTAEVFLQAWRSLPRYRERGLPFSAYLFRIARNSLIDYYRRSQRGETINPDYFDDLPVGGDSLVKVLASKEEHQELYRTLLKLRENYRTVLVLRFLNGLSPRETAQVMKRSEGAIRVIQHRALSALRKLLNGYERKEGS